LLMPARPAVAVPVERRDPGINNFDEATLPDTNGRELLSIGPVLGEGAVRMESRTSLLGN
jgi:hypothetical protein